jgi:hypothetical protein
MVILAGIRSSDTLKQRFQGHGTELGKLLATMMSRYTNTVGGSLSDFGSLN